MHCYITVGGSGTRLKGISPKDKHLLYYKNYRIIEWIQKIIYPSNIIGIEKTANRKETLSLIPELEDILIVDCDIIPFGFDKTIIDLNQDCVFVFRSNKNKYGSVITDDNDKIIKTSEDANISNIKCSGIYFIKNLKLTISQMTTPNSIVSGMIGAKCIHEDTFMRFGDAEDYLESVVQL